MKTYLTDEETAVLLDLFEIKTDADADALLDQAFVDSVALLEAEEAAAAAAQD